MRILLLLTTLLFARDNPFVPVITNKNKTIIKKNYFSSQKINLPDDARVIKEVTIKYQTLTGTIKELQITIDQAINWHSPLYLSTYKKPVISKNVKVGFLEFIIKDNRLILLSKDKIIRKFLLVKPYRYVLDFRANKNFLTYSKKTDTFIKKIALGNHKNFYRVVLYLDGAYKIDVKKEKKGYLIEFK